jgi:hypothetical protein
MFMRDTVPRLRAFFTYAQRRRSVLAPFSLILARNASSSAHQDS